MPDVTREGLAYFLIAILVAGVAATYLKTRKHRRREALRRRGIKTYDR